MSAHSAQPTLEKRPPIVVVVGHVDHGKTSLLDYIRINCAKAASSETGEPRPVAGREAGGITQSVGAYEIEVPPKEEPKSRESEANRGIPRQAPRAFGSETQARRGDFANPIRKITFIDTPGHEAFTKMRVRGAHIADIGILVIAADDSVKAQTKEAIKALFDTKTPFVVAITKVDKSNADIERVKNDLTTEGVLLEGYGGSISYQAVSSKTGEGIPELLDLLLLTADVENLTYDPDVIAEGVVLEAHMDKKRGNTVTVILQNGTLRRGDLIMTPSAKGKIKILENFLGKTVNELAPSNPAIILGFESLPQIGDAYKAGKLSDEQIESVRIPERKLALSNKNTKQVLPIILKADVAGSLEALQDLLKKTILGEYQSINIISQSVGEITDGDVKDAVATKALIVGFRTVANKAAENLAQGQGVTIIVDDIIYKLIERVEEFLKTIAIDGPEGELEVLKVFSAQGSKQTVGGKVIRGQMKIKAVFDIRRGSASPSTTRASSEPQPNSSGPSGSPQEAHIIGKGRIVTLQQQKKDVNAVQIGMECGMAVECNTPILSNDILVIQ